VNGCFNEMTTLNGNAGLETTEFLLSKIDDFGTPKAYNHYAVGWAHALCAPYQWTKQVASHWAAPATQPSCTGQRTEGKGELRNQFIKTIDIAPTILEAAGLPAQRRLTESRRRRWKGSACWLVRDGTAPETHDVHTSRCFGNRGIYTRAGPR